MKVLIASPGDLSPRLARTVLWRAGIERVFTSSAAEAMELARELEPNLILVDGSRLPDAAQLVRRLRADAQTRKISIAAIAGRGRADVQDALQRAGVNLLVTAGIDIGLFDRRLEELLDVPPRRETRLSASFQLWCRSEASGPLKQAVVLNISVRGMLIETDEELPNGSTVEMRLPLPGDSEPLALMGLVERQAAAHEGKFRTGVQFLILRDHARERIRAFIEAEAR